MAIEKINIEKFLELAKKHPVLDVRSPGEYKHGHIPGANSIPLFTDEERKIVGTTYKQQSRERAIKVGLDFFGPRMSKMVEDVELAISNRQSAKDSNLDLPVANCLLIYCWRGGMRSAGVAWLMDLYGFKVYTLAGGYKTFRNHVLNTFRFPFKFRVVGGYTGSAKTGLLHTLKQKGESIIDLEAIAQHKGSAFGSIGMPVQPGQEMFENLLGMQLLNHVEKYSTDKEDTDNNDHIWIEDESQRIGLVNIPGDLWKNMRNSHIYFLDIPFEIRLQHVVSEYGKLDQQKLIDAINRIREKLGGLNAKMAISLLEQGETLESFRILLGYYDKLYFKALHNREAINSLLHTIDCKSIIPENADQLIHYNLQKPEKV